LLLALIDRCEQLGYRRMVAVIGDRDNLASIRLHESAGFEPSGTLRSVGFKLGRWVDSVLMERPLGEGDATLPDAPLHKTESS
jgi:phosphinothricin acetyltransferase